MEYKVRITETREMTVTVDALNMLKAKQTVEQDIKHGAYKLDREHTKDVKCEALYPEKQLAYYEFKQAISYNKMSRNGKLAAVLHITPKAKVAGNQPLYSQNSKSRQ